MATATPAAKAPPLAGVPLPLEIRVHGRGGQGGVTCAKLLACIYGELGLRVQTFGDYGSERAGAPVRAFTRVDTSPIANWNKVYRPHHLLVLDAGLLGDDVLDGAEPGALLLLNTARPPGAFGDRYAPFRFATLDATAVARRHGIGSTALVVVNTTIAGAYAKALGLPWEAVERGFAALGLEDDLGAAKEAWELVRVREPSAPRARPPAARIAPPPAPPVPGIAEQVEDLPTELQTGSWRTQAPRYRSHLAPCNASCPAGNDVVGFVQALARGGVEAAAKVLLRTQPLPSVCGRVCPAPCMSACNREAYDGAVNVRALERWIGDHAAAGVEPWERAAVPRSVAIAGSGPAGLAAAFVLARQGHRVTLLEREPRLGGVLRTGIPSYRLPHDVLDRDLERILALGVEARCGAVVDADGLRMLSEGHDAVVLAVGLPRPTGLDAPGLPLPGVVDGLRFLDDAKNGKSDRIPRLSGHVLVVGGGNTAVDCARTALRAGASRVTIAYRRGRKEMPAIAEEIDEALGEGVVLLTHRQPVRFHGAAAVTAVELAEVDLGEPDASGRRRPVVSDRKSLVACDAVLLAVGQGADLSLLPRGWEARDGRIHDGDRPTNVWLAGDVATWEGTVTHAVGHGRWVAACALAALEGREGPPRPFPARDEVVSPAHVRFGHFEVAPPQRVRHLPEERRRSFDEVNLGLAGPAEAARCFSCGSCTSCDTCLRYCPEGIIRRDGAGYVIDEAYCKGCGMCVAECPRRAMEMAADAAAR